MTLETSELRDSMPGVSADSPFKEYADDLNDFFENAAVGLHWVNGDGIIIRANRAELDLLGYTPDEYIGHHIGEFHVDQDAIEEILRRLTCDETLSSYEARLRCKDGSIRDVLIDSNVLWRDGVFVHSRCFTRDITAHKLLGDALRTSEDRLRRAQEAGRLGTWDWNVRTNELVWDGVERVHGVEAGSFGGSFEAYLADMHPDDRERVTSGIAAAAESGGEVDVEYRIVWPDGSVHWVAGNGRAFPGEDGRTERMMGTCQDITRRKLAEDELRGAIAALQEANAVKDEFVGLVSHELKTPITTILGNAHVLHARFEQLDDETRRESLADIRYEAERLQRIIDNLLVLARLDAGAEIETEPLIIARLAERLAKDHRARFPHRAINLVETADPAPVMASPVYIEQVLRNLLSNAEKYSPVDRAIDITIGVADGRLHVSVGDGGAGVAPDELEAIFSPFYRSPHVSLRAPGVGIGLAVCRRLIDAQAGTLSAANRPDGGLKVTFALPLAEIPAND